MTTPAVALPPPGVDDVLYAIDVTSFTRRHYEAQRRGGDHLAPLRNGEPGGATRSVLAWFVNVLADRRPAYLVATTDDPRADGLERSWRRAILETYKADRFFDRDFADQEARICEILRLHRVPVLSALRYESIDMLAAATKHAVALGLRVVVVSRNKDVLQLVDDARGVSVWDGRSETMLTDTAVRELGRFGGVGPSQLADLFALAGEKSDGIPGLDGIGIGTASKLLAEYGTLDGVLRNAPTMKPSKVQETLLAHVDDAWRYRRMTGVAEDAPIELDPWEARLGWDEDSVLAVEAINETLGLSYAVKMVAYPKRPPSSAVQTRALSMPLRDEQIPGAEPWDLGSVALDERPGPGARAPAPPSDVSVHERPTSPQAVPAASVAPTPPPAAVEPAKGQPSAGRGPPKQLTLFF